MTAQEAPGAPLAAQQPPRPPAGWPINSRPGDAPLDVPTDVLTSYHYFKRVDIGAVRSWGTRIIGDSGAFSAHSLGAEVDREDFHAWCSRWRDALLWAASLDVIGNADATWVNWCAARRDGLNLVPTIHYLGAPSLMDRYVAQGVDLIGLGGLVALSSERTRAMRWLVGMFRHARDNYPHVRFHGWGLSAPDILDRLPFWSADSSSFASAFQFGVLRLFDPRTGRLFAVELDGRQTAKHRALLAEHYRVDWRAIAISTPATRRPVGRAALRAVQLYGRWLAARQRVSPPPSLAGRLWGQLGPATVGALGRDGSSSYAMNPTNGPAPLLVGPRPVGALGSRGTQVAKAIDPDDAGPGFI